MKLYWFIEKKAETETREIVYFITMVSRNPRQIVGFDVAYDKAPERIQKIVDHAPEAKYYCTDGYNGYVDIIYPEKHVRNIHNKSDTFTVEGINADLPLCHPIQHFVCDCRDAFVGDLKAIYFFCRLGNIPPAHPFCVHPRNLILHTAYLLMDRAYEWDETRALAVELGYTPIVPPKRNRKNPWLYDRKLYKQRNQVERLFRRLKRFRRIFTR